MSEKRTLSRGERWIVGLTLGFAVLILGAYVWVGHDAEIAVYAGVPTALFGESSQAIQEEPLDWQVDVNNASAAALQALPGVGEALAQRIIDYREANGPFTAPEDLLGVSGIGESKLEGMRELLTFGEVTE